MSLGKEGRSHKLPYRPHAKLCSDYGDELTGFGPFSRRTQNFQTKGKPVVFQALTINDARVDTQARICQHHAVASAPGAPRLYSHSPRTPILDNGCLF
jgi:hypothetical protein